MKRYEKESLLKNFFIFFFMQLILLFIIIVQNYKEEVHSFKDKIYKEMKICSLDLKCKDLKLDFEKIKKNIELNKLYQKKTLFSYFKVPTSDIYYLKITLPKKEYEKKLFLIKQKLIIKFLFYAILIALFSFLFSLYSLYPLKKALYLNEEFMKDILHDINTPLHSILINFKLFQKEIGYNRKIERINQSIEKIIHLQSNLKSCLNQSPLQKEKINLKSLVAKEVDYFMKEYPNLVFEQSLKDIFIFSNKEAFERILHNILSNACKYNKKNGKVIIKIKKDSLIIEDTGVGIKNPKKVFERYYKESQRGLGIGMHIVKKLCEQLDIKIELSSKVNSGTTIVLNFSKVMVK